MTEHNSHIQELLSLYQEFPFEFHPLWQSIINGKLSRKQVLLAEAQHYLRTKRGQILRCRALSQIEKKSQRIFENLTETYIEECTDTVTLNHLGLIQRMLVNNGFDDESLSNLVNTPGNIAAISLYEEITNRGAGCHIVGAGFVEYYYSQLCPKIFESYTKLYGFAAKDVETYELHGTMDETHANRAFEILEEAIDLHGYQLIYYSVRDAFVATSLHYDGMLQAATGEVSYWNGKK